MSWLVYVGLKLMVNIGQCACKKRSGDERPTAHACQMVARPAHAAKPSLTCSADMSGELHAKYEDGVRCREGKL